MADKETDLDALDDASFDDASFDDTADDDVTEDDDADVELDVELVDEPEPTAPLVGTVCFQFDGIFTGATATADMRNMMIVSLAIYLAAWWWLEPAYGNHGLWAAMMVFFVARGVTFWMRMPALERKAFA